MCHHRDVPRETVEETADEDDETPSFASEERDVDVDLLEADDD